MARRSRRLRRLLQQCGLDYVASETCGTCSRIGLLVCLCATCTVSARSSYRSSSPAATSKPNCSASSKSASSRPSAHSSTPSAPRCCTVPPALRGCISPLKSGKGKHYVFGPSLNASLSNSCSAIYSVTSAPIFYGNQGATSLPTTANTREHRNQDAFRRNGTRTGSSLTADWEHSAGNEFSAAVFESARESTEEVLSRFRIAAISSGLK
jgi:hypothetical protein